MRFECKQQDWVRRRRRRRRRRKTWRWLTSTSDEVANAEAAVRDESRSNDGRFLLLLRRRDEQPASSTRGAGCQSRVKILSEGDRKGGLAHGASRAAPRRAYSRAREELEMLLSATAPTTAAFRQPVVTTRLLTTLATFLVACRAPILSIPWPLRPVAVARSPLQNYPRLPG